MKEKFEECQACTGWQQKNGTPNIGNPYDKGAYSFASTL